MSHGRRVVHVIRSDGFAGVERYVATTATELSHRGWEVTVIGGDRVRMGDALPGTVEHRIGDTTVQVARSLLAVGQSDIVHAHMTAAELPAALMKRRLGARLFVTRHFALARGRSVIGRVARPVIARQVDLQIAISQFVADSIEEPACVVPNGVGSGLDSRIDRHDLVVVMQRLEAEKDTATAIRAWALSNLADRGWRLEIYGRGSQDAKLRALSSSLGVADSVAFAGFTDQPQRALSRAAVLLATAIAEPFGLAVVEAMAEGTPVVASDSGAHRETVGLDGVYFTAGDPADCAAQLVSLVDDGSGRRDRGQRLQERQRKMFTIAAHVDGLEQAYDGAQSPRLGRR